MTTQQPRWAEGQVVLAPDFNDVVLGQHLKFTHVRDTEYGQFHFIVDDIGYRYHTKQRFMSNDILITKVETKETE